MQATHRCRERRFAEDCRRRGPGATRERDGSIGRSIIPTGIAADLQLDQMETGMSTGPLRFLCVGAGRDGTLTVASYITAILRGAGMEGECVHEMHSRDLYDLQCELAEHPEQAENAQRLRDTIAGFACMAASGNSYAGILPIFADLYPSLKLIHLRRRDKQAFIASQIRNSRLFPEPYVNYSTEIGVMRRISAFHTGELSRTQWHALSLYDKFDWYYEYTHRSIAAAYHLFPAVLQIETEDLSTTDTRRRLADFIANGPIELPRPRQLNGHALIDIDHFPAEQRAFAQWMFGRLSVEEIAENSTFLVDHVLNSTVAWLGYLRTDVAGRIDPRGERFGPKRRHSCPASTSIAVKSPGSYPR